MGKKSAGAVHLICKDACVLSRNSDLIKSENYLELMNFISKVIQKELTNKPETVARKTGASRNLASTKAAPADVLI